jgi:hypothetical protein
MTTQAETGGAVIRDNFNRGIGDGKRAAQNLFNSLSPEEAEKAVKRTIKREERREMTPYQGGYLHGLRRWLP